MSTGTETKSETKAKETDKAPAETPSAEIKTIQKDMDDLARHFQESLSTIQSFVESSMKAVVEVVDVVKPAGSQPIKSGESESEDMGEMINKEDLEL